MICLRGSEIEIRSKVVYGENERGGVSCWMSKQTQSSKEDTP